MKKTVSLFLTVCFVITILSSALFFQASAETILPTDVASPRDGCVFLGIEGKYITHIQEALDLINEIRLEACREGVKSPGTGNALTLDDYVPIKWSADLEYVARIRAAEASIIMDHKRLNGESIWGLRGPNGIGSSGEVIAWNWGQTMTAGITQWYGEKSDWVNSTPGAVTGHYTQMIDPNNRYVGLGTFYTSSAKYPNTTAGEFSRSTAALDTTYGAATGNIIQTVEVQNSFISYELSGSDTLSVSATVTCTDYWSGNIITRGLVVLGDLANGIRWSSSDDGIVTVSNGRLTVKSCGSAVITAILPDGSALTKSVSYEHSYKTTTTQATCAADGKTVKTCTICGDTSTQTIPKTNQHSFGKWVVTKAATAGSDGVETRTCSVCNAKETRKITYVPPETSTPSESSGETSSESSPNEPSSDVNSEETSSEVSSGEPSEEVSPDESSEEVSPDETSEEVSPDETPDESAEEIASDEPAEETNSDETSSESDSPSASSSSSDSSMPASNGESKAEESSGSGGLSVTQIVLIAVGGVLVCAAVIAILLIAVKRKKK